MHVDIIKPDEELYSGEASALVVPGSDGLIGILNNHAPLITSLKTGQIKVTTDKGEEFFDVKGGVVEVLKNKVVILAE